MELLIHYLNSSLAGGFWVALPAMLGLGFMQAFSPCMAVLTPLVIGSSRQSGFNRSFLFIAGYTVTLMFLGLLAARMGKVLTLPGWFWAPFLGSLYLISGLMLLGVKFPFAISKFYVFRHRPQWLRLIINRGSLNPGALGVISALTPSPCTIPIIMAITAYVLASGQTMLGALALGSFGLGHSLPLALAFLPWVRNLFRPNRFTGTLRSVIGMILIAISLYFLVTPPDFLNPSSMTSHNH